MRQPESNISFEEISGKKEKLTEIKLRKSEIKNLIEGLDDKFEKMILITEKGEKI